MNVAGFKFAVEILQKGDWTILCLMADDIAAARMAYSLMTLHPYDGVRLALIDPALRDSPERVIWEHLKAPEPEPTDDSGVLDLIPLPDGHPLLTSDLDDDDTGNAPRSFRLGSEREIDDPGAAARRRISAGRVDDGKRPRMWPPTRRAIGKALGAGMIVSGIFGAALWNLPERPGPEAPMEPPRLAAPAPARFAETPTEPPAPTPPPPAAAAPTSAEVPDTTALFGKWAKDAAGCATDYLLFQPERAFMVDSRLALASGGPAFYGVVENDLTVFDGATESRYGRLGPDQLRQVSFFSTRTGPHEGGPTLVRCANTDPPDRVDWTPNPIDRATALARLADARSRFEAARAVAGSSQVPAPLRGRWGARCDIGYLEWEDGVQTSWSTFGGAEKRAIAAFKELGSRYTIVFEGGYTQFYDLVADDQVVLSGVGAQGVMTDPAPPPWTGRRCPVPTNS
ncbi:hypothetical protein N825_16770 [Skermanella stibiiresistens SB22]|uniref:Uncharacterized protein n=1 Tax=Skermanella stibiiresistens SB22 TaxID=1385369 RepID=W9GUZ1_9PROT|nr:hypothetical protein [Skermanella stibiiresistens]EWY37705.1 hypothetical protein N825_16770 [Skermanella stibiiresistens SB22]